MDNRVIIVIPVYKEKLDSMELISLNQCLKVLRNYRKVFIAPNTLIKDGINEFTEGKIDFELFSSKYFENTRTYSSLLLSSNFYKRFWKYQFILIHQLDAFVFKDDLDFWIKQGFDYIGAPWYEHYYNSKDKSRLLDVGNGGFSLRKTRTLFVLAMINSIIRGKRQKNLNVQEDFVWARNILPNYPFKKLPESSKALHFAFETNPEKAYMTIGNKLPFGVHAWYISERHLNFYKPFIEAEGYQF